ncbi:MAG: zinc-binding dehydrogenase [Flavobacteriales bacterium]|nr:zinc-binding dehydrogenase [Flavobacteriales bacterium]
MKAWTLIAHGAPERAFALREHPDPDPKPHQVVIRCEGFGLNYADAMCVRGLYREAPPPPCIIGYEVVGRVERVGSAAPAGLLGKRVVAMTRFGGYGELAATDHRACAIIPDDLPFGEALALATQGVTAWYMAKVLSPLQAGERVLVHSAAGGVGQLLVQLAAQAGCEVFAVVGSASKADRARELGAALAIDRSTGDYELQALKRLGKHRLDASFNAVAGRTFKKDMRLLGSGGRLVLFGGAERGGTSTLGFVWRMGLVLPIFLMMKSKSILGVNMLKLGDHKPELIAECLRGVMDAHASGALAPRVHDTYDAPRLPEALSALASGRTLGKVAVRW